MGWRLNVFGVLRGVDVDRDGPKQMHVDLEPSVFPDESWQLERNDLRLLVGGSAPREQPIRRVLDELGAPARGNVYAIAFRSSAASSLRS
jgi:hypothetical protein